MLIYITLCFIPLIAMFICIAVLTKGFKVWKGLLSCVLGLAAVIPIAIMQMFVGGLLSAKNLFGVLISALIVNGLIEEAIKMVFMFLLPAKNTRESLFFFVRNAKRTGFRLLRNSILPYQRF